MKREERIQHLPTIRRMPTYLHHLKSLAAEGVETISAATLAERLGFEPIQVRKDLALTGVVGKPRVGFEVMPLLQAIIDYLGWRDARKAVLVGVGSLGSAILGYDGFEAFGLQIVAAFDASADLVGKVVHGYEVMSTQDISDQVMEFQANIGVVSVPALAAQTVAEQLIAVGVKGIWNFAPVSLQVPEGVVVQTVDLAESLGVLSVRLSRVMPDV